MNIYDLISRAQKLRKETQLDSVSPDRVGGLHEDTLKYINEFQLLASSPSLHKAYASVSAMQSDKSPKSDLTGKPLKPGQLVVIVPANQTDATAGDVYRYDGPSGNTSAWTFVAKIGAVPADAELSATSTNPPQNKVVTEKLTELESNIGNLPSYKIIDYSLPIVKTYTGVIELASIKVGKATQGQVRIQGEHDFAYLWYIMGQKEGSAVIISQGSYQWGNFDQIFNLADYLSDVDESLYDYFWIQLNSGQANSVSHFALTSVTASFPIATNIISNIIADVELLKEDTQKPMWHNNEYYNFYTKLGSGIEDNITTSSFLKASISGVVNKIRLYINKVGKVDIIVGKVDDIVTDFRTYSFNFDSIGVHEVVCEIPIEKGEYVGFGHVEQDNLPFDTSAFGTTSRFIQANETDGKTTDVAGFVCLQYSILPTTLSGNAYCSAISLGEEYGHHIAGTPYVQPTDVINIPSNQWYTYRNDDTIYNGIIRRIKLHPTTDCDVTFGLGIIDQRGWAIIDSEFSLPFKANEGWKACNIAISKGQRIFIKGDITMYGTTNKNAFYQGGGLITESTDNIHLINTYVASFGYEVDGIKYGVSNNTSEVVTQVKEDIVAIEEKINNISLDTLYLTSKSKVFRLSVDDNGNLTTIEVQGKKITILGNSIEIHPISEIWWADDRGMASSTRDKDYPHRLANVLTNQHETPTSVSVYNIAEWERMMDSWSMDRLDTYLEDTDLVILRVGENATYDSTYATRYGELLSYIRSKTNAPIIVGGVFWKSSNKDNAVKSVLSSYSDIPFVEFSDLDSAEYKSYIGAKVYGNDGVWHTVNNNGVANHPGDKGFKAMAERLLPYVLDKLNL